MAGSLSPSPLRPLSPSSDLPRWLSLSKAAWYASMCKRTLMKHIESGEIYGKKIGGKHYVDRLTIDSFFYEGDLRENAIVRSILGAR